MQKLLAAIDVIQGIKDGAQAVKEVFDIIPGDLGKILLALIVFLVLKKLAGLLKSVLDKMLSKTNLDEKLAAKIGYKSGISSMITSIAYLVLVIYAAVISLNVAELNTASEPLENMLQTLIGYVPQIIGAGILLYILMFIASIVKQLLGNVLEVARIDERIGSTSGTPVASALVSAAYGFLILLFIPAVLDILNIEAISAPIRTITTQITNAIPNVLLAGVIVAIGFLIAQIASRVITNILKGTSIDALPAKMGVSLPEQGKTALSSLIGTVVMASILVTVISAALNELNIGILSSISVALVPGFFSVLLAAIILFAGVLGSKYAFNLLKDKNMLFAQVIRALILVIVTVVALDRAGIASHLTSLPYQVAIYALGFVVAIGGSIALGLGSKDYVANWLSKRS